MAKHLTEPTNTVFTKDFITKHSRLWQSHITQIADYLTPGPNVWWKWRDDGSMEFLDGPAEQQEKQEGPQLFHFRSSSLKDVRIDLKGAWDACQITPENLPVYKIRDSEGKLMYNRDSLDAECEEMDQDLPSQEANYIPKEPKSIFEAEDNNHVHQINFEDEYGCKLC